MHRIEQLLRRRIGLDVASVGSSLIERTIRLRMKARQIASPQAYLALLESAPAEWEELLEAVVITETWFFRDQEPFTAFAQLVRPRGPLPRGADQSLKSNVHSLKPGETSDDRLATLDSNVVRILSVPCATGEEPYSLAMALVDAGIPRAHFHIDAVDLSARALARARLATYGRNSFRGKGGPGRPPFAFRDRHFIRLGETYQLHEVIQTCVTFQRGNLLAADFLAAGPSYDFIFCRNLLIYFDRPTQSLALRQLHRLLAPGGYLFVSPAEMPLATDHGFVPAGLPLASACRKPPTPDNGAALCQGSGARGQVLTSDPAPLSPLPTPAAGAAQARSEFRVPSSEFSRSAVATSERETQNSERNSATFGLGAARPVEYGSSTVSGDRTDLLHRARALADTGRLAEAATLCAAHLQTNGPTAPVYYLMGLITEAQSRDEWRVTSDVASPSPGPADAALAYYRKALYLEPDHYETLLQLSLLLRKQGDAAGAATLRRRLRRLEVTGARGQMSGPDPAHLTPGTSSPSTAGLD